METLVTFNSDGFALAGELDVPSRGAERKPAIIILHDLGSHRDGPQVRWTLAPENTMKFARFMVTNGMLKAPPDSWREYFFPEIHSVDGS